MFINLIVIKLKLGILKSKFILIKRQKLMSKKSIKKSRFLIKKLKEDQNKVIISSKKWLKLNIKNKRTKKCYLIKVSSIDRVNL